MTTSISKRANAYRSALRQGLNDGLSIKAATDAAKRAARGGIDIPQQKPVILTDAELRLIDENELTAEECDRLLELEQAEDIAEMKAFNITLPTARKLSNFSIRQQMDEEAREDAWVDYTTQCLNEAKEQPIINFGDKCNASLDNCPDCGDPLCMGNCEKGYEPGGLVAQAMSDIAKEHGNEPKDLGDFGAGTLADAWRDAVGILTPTELRMTGKAAFMTELDEAAEFAQAKRDTIASLEDVDEETAAITHANKLDNQLEEARATVKELLDKLDEYTNDSLHSYGRTPSWYIKATAVSCGIDLDDDQPEVRVRDCDIPATLRAIELPATEDHNYYRLWFDGDNEMSQFLAGRSLYVSDDRSIKDEAGLVVGMWFYAHFGPTPVS